MNDLKSVTAHLPIRDATVPDQLIFSLLQNTGRPAIPAVTIGGYVKVGQMIAQAQGHHSAHIHSSVSGTVTDIKPAPYFTGLNYPSIQIANDHLYTRMPFMPYRGNIKDASPTELLQRITDAGIVGLGGEMTPTHLKLDPGQKIQDLIINATESEPYLSSDNRQMVENTRHIFTGIDVAIRLIDPERITIAIENNKPTAIIALRNYALRYKNMQVLTLPSQFPNGAERVLVRHITKKRIRRHALEANAVLLNVSTLAQIGTTITTGVPFINRVITLAGDAIHKQLNVRVRLGTPIHHLLSELTPERQAELGDCKIVIGGPLTGIAQQSLDVPIIKGTTGLLVLRHHEPPARDCIRCGRCIDHCPAYIMPIYAAKQGLQANECMECGLCSYYCPSKINLVQQIREQKK